MKFLVNDPKLAEKVYDNLTNLYSGLNGQLNPVTGEFVFQQEYLGQSFFETRSDKGPWVPFFITRYRNDDGDRGVWFKPDLPANHPNKTQLDDMLRTIEHAINQYDTIRHARHEAAKTNFCTAVVLADNTKQEALLMDKLKSDKEFLSHLVRVVQTTLNDALPGMLTPFIDTIASYMIKPFLHNASSGSMILFKEPEHTQQRRLIIKLEDEQREQEHVGQLMDMYPSTP